MSLLLKLIKVLSFFSSGDIYHSWSNNEVESYFNEIGRNCGVDPEQLIRIHTFILVIEESIRQEWVIEMISNNVAFC